MITDFNAVFWMIIHDIQWRENMEKAIAQRLNLASLASGTQIIRNEKGWRTNEKSVEYAWFSYINHQPKSYYAGLFSIKLKPSDFRGIINQEELVQGIFTFDANGNIIHFHFETNKNDFYDPIRASTCFDLFAHDIDNKSDYVVLNFNINTLGTHSAITTNGSGSFFANNFREEIFKMGKQFAANSNNESMMLFFQHIYSI